MRRFIQRLANSTTNLARTPAAHLAFLAIILGATQLLAQGELDTVSHRAIDNRPGIGRQIQIPAGLPAEFQDARLLSELIRTVQELKPGSDPLKQYSKLAELRKQLQRPTKQPVEPTDAQKPTLPKNSETPDTVDPSKATRDPSKATTSDVLDRLKKDSRSSELLKAILSGLDPKRKKSDDHLQNPNSAAHKNSPAPSSIEERLSNLKPFQPPSVEDPGKAKITVSDIENRLSDLKRRINIHFPKAFKRRSKSPETNVASKNEEPQSINPPQRSESVDTSTPKPPGRASKPAKVASNGTRKLPQLFKSGSSSVEPSRQIMESLMEAMDSTGVEMLDAIRDPKRRQDWRWFNDVRRKTTRNLRPYKRYLSGNMPRMSWAAPAPRRRVPEISMPSVDASTTSDIVPLLGLLAVGGLLGMVAWRRFLVPPDVDDSGEQIPPALSVSTVVDRRSVVAACHRLAVRRLGWRSQFWNHKRMFRSLSNAVPQRAGDVRRLGKVYEYARYAPSDFALNDGQLANIRNILSALEVNETVQEV